MSGNPKLQVKRLRNQKPHIREVMVMKFRVLAAALASVTVAGMTLAAGAASAEPVVAKLQAPVPSSTKAVAGGAVFECLGDMCAARAPASESSGLRGCKDLVRQVGAVASFGPTSKPLSPDEVTACNSSAKH